MNGNYIKLDRSILDWEWYKNENTFCVFLHCLLKANWKDGRFEGVEVPRGSFVTSISKLSEELELSYQSVRTALNHLKSTGELTVTPHSKFSVVTVNNYDVYQSSTGKSTGKQQATNRQLTGKQQATNNNRRKEEEEEREESNKGRSSKRFKPPTADEVWEYCLETNRKIDVDRFIDFYESKGWMVGKNKMRDWKAAVRGWESRDKDRKNSKPKETSWEDA